MLFLGRKLGVAAERKFRVFGSGLYGGNGSYFCEIGKIHYVYYLEGVGDIFQALYSTGVFVIFGSLKCFGVTLKLFMSKSYCETSKMDSVFGDIGDRSSAHRSISLTYR